MNKEQERFWRILHEPSERSCRNCKFNEENYLVRLECDKVVGLCGINGYNAGTIKWVWDEIVR